MYVSQYIYTIYSTYRILVNAEAERLEEAGSARGRASGIAGALNLSPGHDASTEDVGIFRCESP